MLPWGCFVAWGCGIRMVVRFIHSQDRKGVGILKGCHEVRPQSMYCILYVTSKDGSGLVLVFSRRIYRPWRKFCTIEVWRTAICSEVHHIYGRSLEHHKTTSLRVMNNPLGRIASFFVRSSRSHITSGINVASKKNLSHRPFSLWAPLRSSFVPDMPPVNTTDRLAQLRQLMQQNSVDIYGMSGMYIGSCYSN